MIRKLKKIAGIATITASLCSPVWADESTLTILMLEGLDKGAMRTVADAYEAQNPDVTVVIQALPWGQFFQVSELRLRSADDSIDIVYTDAPVVANYAANGYIETFPQSLESEAEAKLVDAALNAGSFEGSLYALPVNSSAQVLYYNIDLFEEAGLTPPAGLTANSSTSATDITSLADNDRMTWEAVSDAAQKITKSDNGRTSVWGFTFEQFGELYQLQPLGESIGSSIISDDGNSAAGLLDGEQWRAAATYWSNLFNEWNVSPRALGFGEATQLFVNGQMGMFVGGTWNIAALTGSDVNFGVAPHPKFENGNAVTPTGSWFLGVSSASTQKDIAQDFASFVTLSEEGTQLWFDNLNQLPTTNALLDHIANSSDFDAFPASVMRLSAYESRATASPRPITIAFSQLQDAFRTAFVDIANGVEIDEALATAVDSYDSAARRLNK